jgi:thioredoxin 2
MSPDDENGVSADQAGVIVKCPNCGQKNRLPYAQTDRTARCGKCHTTLTAPAVPVSVPSSDVFDAIVSKSSVPVLVDFWADWCGPCHMVAPEIVKVATKQAGQLLVVKVDTEALSDIAARYGIRSLPTMALFAGGREAGRVMGARPAQDILSFVTSTVASAVKK